MGVALRSVSKTAQTFLRGPTSRRERSLVQSERTAMTSSTQRHIRLTVVDPTRSSASTGAGSERVMRTLSQAGDKLGVITPQSE